MVAHGDPLAPAKGGCSARDCAGMGTAAVQDSIGAWQPGLDVRSCAPIDGPMGSAELGAERRVGSYCGPGVPTFWVWGPGGGAFDYPFADWRGPPGNR